MRAFFTRHHAVSVRRLAIGLCLAALLGTGTLFGAINSRPDGSRHPALAAMCLKWASDAEPWTCFPGSAFLVAPKVLVSCAHAGPWLEQVKPFRLGFTFDEKLSSDPYVRDVESFHGDPAFDPTNYADPHDLAVFILKEKVTDIRPVSLPPVLNMLDRGNLVWHIFFTVVDRGLTTWDGYPENPSWGDRQYGRGVAKDLTAGLILIGPDEKHPFFGVQPGPGSSGSMALLANSRIAVGVGSLFCMGEMCADGFGYNRLDTIQARDFLKDYLPMKLLPK